MADALTSKASEIKEVNIIGAASPEGPTAFNRTLSERRAQALFSYLSGRTLLPDSIARYSFIGRNWKGLLAEVERDPEVPAHTEVLATLHSIIESIEKGEPDSNLNLEKLKCIAGGEPYRYMYAKMFPSLRTSTLCISYSPLFPMIPDPGFELDIPMLTADFTTLTPLPLPENNMKVCRPFYMDLKTNLLYDALLLPNIGAEFYLGKNLSLGANWMYGWWDKNSIHRYWRAYGGDLNLRWWFGSRAHEKPLTGHHLGIFGGVVTYDFEFGGKGYMGGKPGENLWHRCNLITGLEYGYSLPVARRLNIDFTLGVGYIGGKMVKYIPKNGGYLWQSTHNFRWIGPTKAEISLVWLIGCDNYNRKKGGEL
ncbi:MAG: DUF3575 domain-containing protein [Muribaculaceae bacterium]|nr:DUF3575 domain-containing protein [Muribaculaceae bacterium]